MATIPRQHKFTGSAVPRNISPEEAETGLARSLPRQTTLTDLLVKGIPGLALEATDITASSVGLTDRGDISESATSELPGLRDFIIKHRPALEGTTGLATIFLSALPAAKITKGGGTIGKLFGKIPGAKRLTQLDNKLLKAKARVRLADRKLAKEGISGHDAFGADVLLGGKNVTRKQLANKARKAAFTRGAVQGFAAEGFLYSIANENEFLYSDEASTNLFLASLGVAIPGTIDTIVTNSQTRRFLTDDRINRVAARAIDRGGFNELAETALHERGKTGRIAAVHGADTDQATLHYLAQNAKTSEPAADAGIRLFSKRTSAALEDTARAEHFVDRVTRDGIPGTEGSGFTISKGTAERKIAQHLRALTHTDPTALYGAEFIGRIPSGSSPQKIIRDYDKATRAMFEDAEILAKSKKKGTAEAAQALAEQARFRNQLVPFVARNMELAPVEDVLRHPTQFTGEVLKDSTGDLTVWRAEGSKFGVDSRGQLISPGRKSVNDLSLTEMQGLYASADSAISAFVDGRKTLTLSKNPNWFELDIAEQVARRSEQAGISPRIEYPIGLDRDSAMLESLAQKIDIVKQSDKLGANDALLRERLNLPRLTTYERGLSGIDDTAIDRLIQGIPDGKSLKSYDLQTVKQTIADYRQAADLVEYTAADIDLLGNSFKLGKDLRGNRIEPFIVFKRPSTPNFFSRTHFEERLANRQADQVASLTSVANDGTFVKSQTESLLASADYREAIKTATLSDVSTQGTLPFNGNRAAQTSLNSFDFAFRDHPTMLAAQRIQDNISRESRAYFDSLLNTEIKSLGGRTPSQAFATLRGRANEASSQYLNQFISARRGWDIDAGSVAGKDGLHSFALKDTEKNRRRWQQYFGEEMPVGATLRHQDGTAVLVDETALNGLKSFQHLAENIRRESNALLRAKGLTEIPEMPWYTPARVYDNQFVQFLTDGNGNVVQTVAAKSKSDLNRLVKKLSDDPNSLLHSPGYKLISQDQVEKFAGIWDRAFTGLNDPSIPVVQSGARNKGAGQSPFIEFNAWEEGLQTFQRQYNRLGNDVIELNMRNQIDSARARASAARSGEQPNRGFGGSGATRKRNIHDLYTQALLGKNPLNNQGSIVGGIYNWAESHANSALQSADEFLAETSLNPFTNGKRAAKKQYERLSKEMGDQLPFKDANDFIEQKFATKTPTTVRNLTGKVNQVTAGLVLRWGEMAHSILNVTGMINTSPAVISYFTPRVGETITQFAKRVGHSSHIFETTAGPVSTLDMGKVMHRSMQRAWKGEKAFSPDEWKFMRQRGYLNQEVAEFHRQLSSMGKSNEAWSRFWEGADRWAGMLSDKSEDFSRTYAHMVGLDIAENILGITSREAKHTFAHDVANKVIANYNPLNRPEIFQGGIGAPIGLFQSYMFNYYQRLYRYIETGDARSAALQFSMQAGLFGMATVPGWKQFNDTYAWSEGGEASPYDGVYRRFGREAGDLLTAGVLSNLPKLFSDDGIALYTRGDTAPRLPGANPFPAMQVGADLFAGVGRGIDMFRSEHPGVSAHEITEIIGQMLPNRPLSGLLDVALGYSADRRGNVISNEVNQGLNGIFRVAGFKPLKEAKLNEALFANRREQEMKLAQRKRLLRSGRALLRAEGAQALPALAQKYLEQGGDPAYIKSWIQELILSAENSKAERQLLDVLGDIDKMNQLNRLLDARVNE